jgi:hypothetical protein
MVRGFKKKLGEGLICLVVVGVIIGLSLAMGRREREAGGVGKTGGVSKEVKLREVELMMEYEFELEGPNVQVTFDEKECSVFKARKLGAKGLEKRKASEVVKILYPRIVYTAPH